MSAIPDRIESLAGWLVEAADADRVEVWNPALFTRTGRREAWVMQARIGGGLWEGTHSLLLWADNPGDGGRGKHQSLESEGLSPSQELAVMQVATTAGVPVGEPLLACDDPEVIGAPFLLLVRPAGAAMTERVLTDPVLQQDPDPFIIDLGAALARLHRILPPRVDLGFLGHAQDNPAQQRIAACHARLDRLPAARPVLEWGLRWLELSAPPPSRLCLTHGGFRLGRLAVERGTLTAILDWSLAAWSDPLEDIGSLWARCNRFGGWAQEGGGVSDLLLLRDAYEAAGGHYLAWEAVEYWEILAVVQKTLATLEQALRNQDGPSPSLEQALASRRIVEWEVEILTAIRRIERDGPRLATQPAAPMPGEERPDKNKDSSRESREPSLDRVGGLARRLTGGRRRRMEDAEDA